MPFAAALSEHPNPAHAIGEAVGQVLEALGPAPDLAFLFVTAPLAGALDECAEVVRTLLAPATLVGCSAVSVLADGREVEEAAAVSLWAGAFGDVAPLRLGSGPAGGLLAQLPPFEPSALLLVADPFTFPAEDVFGAVAERWPALPVIGGFASAARGPGGNTLVLDDDLTTAGAVGAFVGPGLTVTPVVSQGCRPIGQPWAVTAAHDNVILELAGRPPMRRLADLADRELSEAEVTSINRGGLHVGRVVDERKLDPERGDFLVRNIVGADQQRGWLAVGDDVQVGETVQFHLRDADTADDDLRALLAGHDADAALVFTCNGRGTNLFDDPHHDAAVVAEYLGRPAAAGFFCAGEFGPVAGHNFVHGYTASIALLREVPVGSKR